MTAIAVVPALVLFVARLSGAGRASFARTTPRSSPRPTT
jgi:hypothetical protein